MHRNVPRIKREIELSIAAQCKLKYVKVYDEINKPERPTKNMVVCAKELNDLILQDVGLLVSATLYQHKRLVL